MSYIRGKYYTYEDGEYIHLPSQMPLKIFDCLVVMRLEEMSLKDFKRAEKKALDDYSGNFNCDDLCEKHGKPTAIEFVRELKKHVEKESKKKNPKSANSKN